LAAVKLIAWHGWLLEGSGSNVYTARTVEMWRREGHDVVLLCQELHPERYPFLDAYGTVGAQGVAGVVDLEREPAPGRAVLLRPLIGPLLPVFVYDEYEGFEVKRFSDLTEEQLESYIAANVASLKAAADWHGGLDGAVVGHAIAGPAIARRALGDGAYVAKVHGSDLEYALREQERFVDLARFGLEGARAVVGATADVLDRTRSFVPTVADRLRTVAPGVAVERFRRMPRRAALETAADLVDEDPDVSLGRPDELDAEVRAALDRRDAGALEALARRYDQAIPDPGAAERLRWLADHPGPVVGFLGKLIPQKGIDLLLGGLALSEGPADDAHALLIGFGTFREWLVATLFALDDGDPEAVRWIRERSGIAFDLSDREVEQAAGLASRVTFTGRLDHRYAPAACAAMDVMVVPSVLEEAFGMVAAEGAAAGALPLVARHSGLAEVGAALEEEVGRPGLFTYQPGPGSSHRIADGIERLLDLPEDEREALRQSVAAYVAREWTWERTAEHLLEPFAGSGA
jgi:glycosyltransferase involved in cell wall biosynthesis